MDQTENAYLYQALKAKEHGGECAVGEVVSGFTLVPDNQHPAGVHPGVEPLIHIAFPADRIEPGVRSFWLSEHRLSERRYSFAQPSRSIMAVGGWTMSDQKPIQTPFDKVVPSIQQQDDGSAPGEDQVREDIGIDNVSSDLDTRDQEGQQ